MKKEKVLVIAEKPQAAMKIAYALAEIAPIKKKIKGITYWEAHTEKKVLLVASAVGHLFGLVEKSNNAFPVFDLKWEANKNAFHYIKALKELVKDVDDVIIATDYDIEGELIGFNILRFICKRNDAKRMKFSTLTKQELIQAYKNVREHIDFGQAYAGETRHYLDWLYGINISRALMQALRRFGKRKVLSIGRVQGPSLALLVKKEKEIKDFKPETYWQAYILVDGVELKYDKNIKEKNKLNEFKKLEGKECNVKTKEERKEISPLPPFDLTTLQVEAFKFFGLSPAETLAIAQKLYLNGLISYPRTSSQKLPFTIGYKRILEKLAKSFRLTSYVKRKRPVEGKKTDPAHPAIFPTGEKAGKLNQAEKQVYELIVRRFIACFCENAVIEEKKVTAEVEGKRFKAKAVEIINKGWLNVYPLKIEQKRVPDIEGKRKIEKVRIEEKKTKAPRRYTSASLVSELAKRNLGTKGTRAMIVETLYKRGYVKEREMKVTPLGFCVASALQENCPLILDEKLTRKFEKELDSIQEEKVKEKMLERKEEIINEAKKIIGKIIEQFKKNEEKIGKALLSASTENEEILCPCPNCKEGKLTIVKSKRNKRYALCKKCKASFPLPRYGLLKFENKKCKNCSFPMITLIRKGKKPWQFCLNPECKGK